jgi:FlaA1/EpsC-like NDP-sugar epimerase
MQDILIIGGTGTLGNALLEELYEHNKITILSRDELKLYSLKRANPKIDICIGDIRDKPFIEDYLLDRDFDYIFHCAALKHVDLGEKFVAEFIKTNLQGTINVIDNMPEYTRYVFFSTDKAVLPINAYGYSKALAEKYLLSQDKNIKIFRWGNILGSRGSVLDYFVKALKNGDEVNITHPSMSRFWMLIEDAVKFTLESCASFSWDSPTVHIPLDLKAAKVVDVVDCLAEILDVKYRISDVHEIRPGEKIHECLYTSHDYCIRSDNAEQYSREELIELLRKAMHGMEK